MDAMPRPRPPHLHRELTRHGKAVWYVRLAKGKRIRIKAAWGTHEFDAEYETAIAGAPRTAHGRSVAGTLEWLHERYTDSTAWTSLAPATRRQRANIFKHVLATAGKQPLKAITKRAIIEGLERRAKTPSAARHFLDSMRGLFEWAKKAQHVTVDPTEGVKAPAEIATEGFLQWTEEDIQRYEARWQIGTRQRVWMAVLLYTGLRRGDAVRLGRQHERNGGIDIIPEKTRRKGTIPVRVKVPILPPLREVLDAGPVGEITFICGANGRPLTKESFGNDFREAAAAAGVKKSAHGLRKIAAARMAQNGATVSELNAVFGWVGSRMALLYTQGADRARIAARAASKLLRTPDEHPIPAPDGKVREREQKN